MRIEASVASRDLLAKPIGKPAEGLFKVWGEAPIRVTERSYRSKKINKKLKKKKNNICSQNYVIPLCRAHRGEFSERGSLNGWGMGGIDVISKVNSAFDSPYRSE